jgi:hypothetical protein
VLRRALLYSTLPTFPRTILALTHPPSPSLLTATSYCLLPIYAGYQACGVLAKLLFVSTLTESHLGIFESIDIQIAALKLANKTRRSFLRYVFHEVCYVMSCYVMLCNATLRSHIVQYFVMPCLAILCYVLCDVMSSYVFYITIYHNMNLTLYQH